MTSKIPYKRDNLRLIQSLTPFFVRPWFYSVTTGAPRCTGGCWAAFERHIQRCWLHLWSQRCAGLPRMERGRLEGANKVLTNREFSVQKHVSTWKCLWSSGRALGRRGRPLALARNAEQFRGEKHEVITGVITRWALNCGGGDTLMQSLTWTTARRKPVLGLRLLIRTRSIQVCLGTQHVSMFSDPIVDSSQSHLTHLGWWVWSRWLAEVRGKASQWRIQGTLNLSWLQVSFANCSPPEIFKRERLQVPERVSDSTCSPFKTLQFATWMHLWSSGLMLLRNSVQGWVQHT